MIRLDLALTVAVWVLTVGVLARDIRRSESSAYGAVPFWGCLVLASTIAATLAYWLPVAFGAR